MNIRRKPDDSWMTWGWWVGGIGFVLFAMYCAHQGARQAADDGLRPLVEATERQKQHWSAHTSKEEKLRTVLQDMAQQQSDPRLPSRTAQSDSDRFVEALYHLNEKMQPGGTGKSLEQFRAEQEQLLRRQEADRLATDAQIQNLLRASREAAVATEQERRYRQQIEYQRQMLESQRAIQQQLQAQQGKQWPFN